MIYLLDTNPCIRYLNGQSDRLRERIDSVGDGNLSVCSVVKAELFLGAMKSNAQQKTLALQLEFLSRFTSCVFDDASAMIYGRIRADMERSGTPIGGNDLMIASIALANGLTLVTHNSREFSRVSGLLLEDWES